MRRVGMIGAGNIARIHAACWSQLPVQLVGIHDLRPEAAAELAAAHGTRAYASSAELLNQVDIVDVCVPTPLHREYVLAAAARGADVFCEKPIARTTADAHAMIEACEQAGVRFFIGQVVRFFHEYERAKAILDSGAIGRPGVIRTTRGGYHPRGWKDWYTRFDWSGGLMLDMMVHDFDYVRWCCGEVERVYSKSLTFADSYTTNYALVTLRFAGGAIGHVEGSWAYPKGMWRTRLEIAGDRGLLDYDNERSAPLRVSMHEAEGGAVAAVAIPENPVDESPFLREIRHFLECVESGAPFRVGPRDALAALRIALAAIESSRSGFPVSPATV